LLLSAGNLQQTHLISLTGPPASRHDLGANVA
jgi:hypothetical protein